MFTLFCSGHFLILSFSALTFVHNQKSQFPGFMRLIFIHEVQHFLLLFISVFNENRNYQHHLIFRPRECSCNGFPGFSGTTDPARRLQSSPSWWRTRWPRKYQSSVQFRPHPFIKNFTDKKMDLQMEPEPSGNFQSLIAFWSENTWICWKHLFIK